MIDTVRPDRNVLADCQWLSGNREGQAALIGRAPGAQRFHFLLCSTVLQEVHRNPSQPQGNGGSFGSTEVTRFRRIGRLVLQIAGTRSCRHILPCAARHGGTVTGGRKKRLAAAICVIFLGGAILVISETTAPQHSISTATWKTPHVSQLTSSFPGNQAAAFATRASHSGGFLH